MPSHALIKRLEALEERQRARQRYRAPPLPPFRPGALGEALRKMIDMAMALGPTESEARMEGSQRNDEE
jgi:hypothetical protein